MSKKKSVKTAAKKARTKKTARAAQKAPAKRAGATRGTRTLTSQLPNNRTSAATIFLYKTDGGFRVRTSPQLLTAAPGFIEWTVVNMVNDDPVEVEITWPAGSPWDGKPIQIRNGNERKSLAGAKAGRYKYNVTANGYTEDPEVEFPVN